MGTACTKTQDAGQNSKYSVHNRVDETQGKTKLSHFLFILQICQSNDSRRSQFVYKYMKNVLCLKRMYALQLPSQFFFNIYARIFFFQRYLFHSLKELAGIRNLLIVSKKVI